MAAKVALVTGASRGIGKGIGNRLRADGWRVETAERATGVDLADPERARSRRRVPVDGGYLAR